MGRSGTSAPSTRAALASSSARVMAGSSLLSRALFASRRVQLVRHHGYPAADLTERENPSVGAMKPQGWQGSDGCVRCRAEGLNPVARRSYVEPHSDDQVVRRHPGKVDACEVAREAGAAVGADEVLGGQIVGAVGAGDMDGDAVVVVVETGQGVTPTNVHVVFGCPLGKHMDQPALLNGDHEELGVGHRP